MTIDPNMKSSVDALCAALKDVDASQISGKDISDVTIETNDKGLTISFDMMVDGAKTPVVLSTMPDIDAPDGSADAIALATLVEKLGALDTTGMTPEQATEFMNQVIASAVEKIQANGGLSTPKPVTGGATIFNLLEILTLLVEAGQEIKKSAKEIKASDNNLQAESYEQQADKTIAMAETAKSLNQKYTIISACMMVASAALSIGSGIAGAVKGSFADTKTQGVAADMAKNVFSDTDPPGAVPLSITTKSGLSAQAELRGSRVDAIKAEFTHGAVADAKAAYQTAVTEHGANSPEAAEAKSAYIESVMAVKEKYDTAFIGNPKSDQAKNEMVVANEFAMKELKYSKVTVSAKDAPPVQEDALTSSDLGRIRGSFEKTYRKSLADENHYVLQAFASMGMLAGQGGQILQQAGQSDVNYKAQGESAEATRKQADAARKQNDYEDDKSLEDSAQKVIDAALQTMAKVFESQREATREIFG